MIGESFNRIKSFVVSIVLLLGVESFAYQRFSDTIKVFQEVEIVNSDLKYVLENVICPFLKDIKYNQTTDLVQITIGEYREGEFGIHYEPDEYKPCSVFGFYFENRNKYKCSVAVCMGIPFIISEISPSNLFKKIRSHFSYTHKVDKSDLPSPKDDGITWRFRITETGIKYESISRFYIPVDKQFDEWPLLPPDRRIKKLDLEADVPREIKSMVKTCP